MRRTFLVLVVSLFFLTPNLPQAHGKAEDPARDGDRRWAICIGVSKYRDHRLPVCPTAGNDAKGLALAMEEHGGFDQVVLFSDDAVEKDPFFPSRQHIRDFLDQLASKIRPSDTVLFSFSGNGWTDEAGRGFLLASDSHIGHLEETAVPVDEIFGLFREKGVQRCIILIDAAREGSKPGSTHGVYPDRYLRKGVTALFYAAARGYSSQPGQKSRNSVFAENLIQGVRGEADRTYGGDRNGVVTLKELASYVNLAVAEWRAHTMARQIPFIEIMDNAHADMMVSSTERLKRAMPRPSALPVPVSELKKADSDTRSTREESRKSAPVEVVKATAPQEELKVVLKERTPDQAGGPSPAPALPIKEAEPASQMNEGGKSVEEKPSSGEGTSRYPKEPAPILPREFAGKRVESEKLAVSTEPKRRIVRLRAKPKEISAEEMKSILVNQGFYSTCWNYNGDFCNPAGNFENQLQENGNGTVLDRATGLMWQRGGSSKAMNWSAAKGYADEANKKRFAGYSDWRIPTVEEMASLFQSSWKNGDLFIDPVFDREQRQCWTMDTRGMDAAWKANFHQGFLMDFPVDSQSSVRLVRSVR